MKKYVALILALVLCLSMCACGEKGNSTKTKEELLAEAKTAKADDILNDIGGNKARAAQYVDEVYCITGHVLEIADDYAIVLAADTGDWNSVVHSDDWYGYAQEVVFRVYLPTTELAELDKCENIQFVGKIESVTTFEYHAIEPISLEITNAFLVQRGVDYQGRYRLG